jgi:phosphate transport system protein
MVRETYQRDLNKLSKEILNMGSLVGTEIRDGVLLLNRDVEMAQKVIDMENEIVAMDHRIEENCMRLIALQQPVARDLRLIISVLKMSIDLETMGNLALEIAVITKMTANAPPMKPVIDILKMSGICQDMLVNTMKAFEHYSAEYIDDGGILLVNTIKTFEPKDAELAKQVAKQDDEVDVLFEQVMDELITIMMEDPKKTIGALDLAIVARNLQRIGKHITKLCENVAFMATGEMNADMPALVSFLRFRMRRAELVAEQLES